MEIVLLLVTMFGLFFAVRFIVKQNRQIIELLKEGHAKPGDLYKPSPNIMPKTDPDDISFDEKNPLDLPPNVKFAVEEGSLTPFGYEEIENA